MPRHDPLTPICLTLSLALTAACSIFDTGAEDTGDEETGGDDGPPMMEGHGVTCCFSGSFANASFTYNAVHFGCQEANTILECIDQDDDTDPADLEAYCDTKCDPTWTVSTKERPAWKWYELDNQVWVPGGAPPAGTYFNSCSAMAANSGLESHIEQGAENSCTPHPVVPYADLVVEEPTHEATFVTPFGGPPAIDITITGDSLTALYSASLHFSLQNCAGGGIDGGTCDLVLSHFEMSQLSSMTVGDYLVTGTSMTLNEPAVAEVTFDECGVSTCEGTFEFSDSLDNPLTFNLFWTQRGSSETIDEGALTLSNGENALGGLDELVGDIHLDLAGEQGTLYVFGSGDDAISGDWATVEFEFDAPIDLR